MIKHKHHTFKHNPVPPKAKPNRGILFVRPIAGNSQQSFEEDATHEKTETPEQETQETKTGQT